MLIKDKKIELFDVQFIGDQTGNREKHCTLKAVCWCYSRQLSQKLKAQFNTDETRLFILNYRDDIAVRDFIRYRLNWYEVTRVDTKDDYRTDLYVYAKDAPASFGVFKKRGL
ncbi:MAG: head-tail adaptor protein [Kiritimatiellae bacterium]|nr:head-tail adaptor protein [Kiritimatiellia bacterium]